LFLKREVTIIISTRRVLLFFLGAIVLSGCEGLLVTDTQSLLAPTFTRSEILGLIAGFGTTFAALPDLISMVRRRSSAGMNPKMAAIMGAFQILWIWYGLLIGSRPVVLWNLIAVVTNSFVVGAYRHYARRERE
jgi:MtN3 and saliva related transmembrane protein